MKSFSQYITEATAERDQSFLDEAEFVFQKVVEDLYKHQLKNYFSDEIEGVRRYATDLGTATENKLYDNVYLVFAPTAKDKRGIFVKIKGTDKKTIALFCLEKKDFATDNPVWSAMSTQYAHLRVTFIHEFIHYLDSTRIGDQRWSAITKAANVFSGKINPRTYYNQPLEFNAFYQQGISRIEGTIKLLFSDFGEDPKDTIKKIETTYKPLFTTNFNDFYKFSIENNVFQKDFIQNLTDKNKKKLMSRYYGLFKDMIQPKLNKLKLMADQYERQHE